ncbi:hypothetical protein [Trujillonella endophytica]|uniref:Uncharacterized protein n=1 Tax=Trujillonella endophytica TaxID=673521 RepID=A0A1H8WPQ8_9ACTN|nr:hypothetical protein [Trujillella endophytica]SEP29612.1 hypothetical protein SAMN05660991_04614 [Trujillella endophytica]
MTLDAELVVPTASETLPVPLSWDGKQGRYDQRSGAEQTAALLYDRMAGDHRAAQTVAFRFLDAWREYVRLSLSELRDVMQQISDKPLPPEGWSDPFDEWADFQPVLAELWPDEDQGAAVTSRALIRLRTAFGSDVVDLAAVQREMLAAAAYFEACESAAHARLELLQDRAQEQLEYQQEMRQYYN